MHLAAPDAHRRATQAAARPTEKTKSLHIPGMARNTLPGHPSFLPTKTPKEEEAGTVSDQPSACSPGTAGKSTHNSCVVILSNSTLQMRTAGVKMSEQPEDAQNRKETQALEPGSCLAAGGINGLFQCSLRWAAWPSHLYSLSWHAKASIGRVIR